METIRREDFGDGIRAPFMNKAGATTPFWELVSRVHDGDVVLHWTTARDGKRPGFVGWSRVDGEPYQVDNLVYSDNSPTSGWEALLRDYVELPEPVIIDVLNLRIEEIKQVQSDIKAKANGLDYFPFAFLKDGTLRPRQGGYLTKVPRALFEVLPELAIARDVSFVESSESPIGGSSNTRIDRRQAREAGYISDPKVRKAIEMQAVTQAIEYYESTGYRKDAIEDVGTTKPFDLLLTGDGDMPPERHVEVKGSTGAAESVELTKGEVNHARTFQPTDLFIVSDIAWSRTGDAVTTTPGTARLVERWSPEDSSLQATRFHHTVPASAEMISSDRPVTEAGAQ
ncbi:protein NO VEIN domain-containing protein [Rhodococcus qingshengii]|uniref:protein NO VEIN domain-containing protein n=1 Tax=Rhodococcus qingshengii TaxID=334542 RepID=UPI002691DE2F